MPYDRDPAQDERRALNTVWNLIGKTLCEIFT